MRYRHEINTKGTLHNEENPEGIYAQRHTLFEVDDDDNMIELIDEFYLDDYESGNIIPDPDPIEYEWNGYSEDWSGISETNNIETWNEYKNKFNTL